MNIKCLTPTFWTADPAFLGSPRDFSAGGSLPGYPIYARRGEGPMTG
jgi:hypothetical protein